MNKKSFIILITVVITAIIIGVIIKSTNKKYNIENLNNENEKNLTLNNELIFNNEDPVDIFSANIKKINKYNETTSILVKGLDSNDANHIGEFEFSISDDTELLWKENKIEISNLKIGQNISITSTGDILESYPIKLTKVTKVIVLDDAL